MAYKDALIADLKYEGAQTKKILEKVPLDKASWKPHEKSMSLGKLATHIAEIPQWASRILTMDEFDFAVHGFSEYTAASTEELLYIFQEKLDYALRDLDSMTDEDFEKTWTVKRGEIVFSKAKKKAIIRGWCHSHLIHHRGQLTVYLRLLDVAVPGMYGPSADEK